MVEPAPGAVELEPEASGLLVVGLAREIETCGRRGVAAGEVLLPAGRLFPLLRQPPEQLDRSRPFRDPKAERQIPGEEAEGLLKLLVFAPVEEGPDDHVLGPGKPGQEEAPAAQQQRRQIGPLLASPLLRSLHEIGSEHETLGSFPTRFAPGRERQRQAEDGSVELPPPELPAVFGLLLFEQLV